MSYMEGVNLGKGKLVWGSRETIEAGPFLLQAAANLGGGAEAESRVTHAQGRSPAESALRWRIDLETV